MISKKEVKHIADLARIGIGENELEKYSKELSAILDFMKELEGIDVSNVRPDSHLIGITNAGREDEEKKFDGTDGIREMFPEKLKGYDRVKSVL